jgi:hypothetical protein
VPRLKCGSLCRCCDHSAEILANFTTFAHFSVSSATSLPNSADDIGIGMPPRSTSFAWRPPPDQSYAGSGTFLDPKSGPVLGSPPNLVFFMFCAAAFLCCMPMALPQSHLIAFCSDLGILPSHGAAMHSVVLGSGFLCRQLWEWFSDRTGGLVTLSVCSATQATALTAFLMTQDEIGLFTVSAFSRRLPSGHRAFLLRFRRRRYRSTRVFLTRAGKRCAQQCLFIDSRSIDGRRAKLSFLR